MLREVEKTEIEFKRGDFTLPLCLQLCPPFSRSAFCMRLHAYRTDATTPHSDTGTCLERPLSPTDFGQSRESRAPPKVLRSDRNFEFLTRSLWWQPPACSSHATSSSSLLFSPKPSNPSERSMFSSRAVLLVSPFSIFVVV